VKNKIVHTKAALRRAFYTCVYYMRLRFQIITVVGSNQGNYFENATACSKCMLKTTVATHLYSNHEIINEADTINSVDKVILNVILFQLVNFPMTTFTYCFFLLTLKAKNYRDIRMAFKVKNSVL